LPVVNITSIGAKGLISFPTGGDHGSFGLEAPRALAVVEEAEGVCIALWACLEGELGGSAHLPVVLGGEGPSGGNGRREQYSGYAEEGSN